MVSSQRENTTRWIFLTAMLCICFPGLLHNAFLAVCVGGTDNLLKTLEAKMQNDGRGGSAPILEVQAMACLSVLNADIVIKRILKQLQGSTVSQLYPCSQQSLQSQQFSLYKVMISERRGLCPAKSGDLMLSERESQFTTAILLIALVRPHGNVFMVNPACFTGVCFCSHVECICLVSRTIDPFLFDPICLSCRKCCFAVLFFRPLRKKFRAWKILKLNVLDIPRYPSAQPFVIDAIVF